MTNIQIKPGRVQLLQFDFAKPFSGGQTFPQTAFRFMYNSYNGFPLVLIELSFNTESLEDEFQLNSVIGCEYSIENPPILTSIAVYKCCELARDHLQEVIKASFKPQEIFPLVRMGSFEDMEDEIRYSLNGS